MVDVLKKSGAGGGALAAMQMPNSKTPDISTLLDHGKETGWKTLASVKGKKDASSIPVRKMEGGLDIPFLEIMLSATKGSGKTVAAVDIRNAWMFDELRAKGNLRTVILSYDDVTKSSLVNYHGERICYEKGLISRAGKVSIEDIEREGVNWLEENDITVYELAKPIVENDQVVYPGLNSQIVETGTYVIGESARIVNQYMKENQRPHILLVDRCSSLDEEAGTLHALNKTGKKAGDRVPFPVGWGIRTDAMNVLRAAFRSLATHAVIYSGLPGKIGPVAVNDEKSDKTDVKQRYKEATWQSRWSADCNLQVESASNEPLDDKGAPMHNGVKTYELWVRTSQTSLVRSSMEVDSTNSGLSKVFEERRPQAKKVA